YGRLISLITSAYGRKGDIDSTDSYYMQNRQWISRNQKMLGETSLLLVQSDYTYTSVMAENNNGKVQSGLDKWADFSDQLSELKKRTSPSVPLGHDLYLAELSQLQLNDNRARYANLKAEYDRMLGKYFTKSSILNVNLKAVEFDSKLSKDKTKNLERDADRVLSDEALPQHHKTRIRILEFLYEMSIQTQRYTNAESYLNQVIAIKKELHGDDSPE